MTLHRPSPPPSLNRPRSNSSPVKPSRNQRPSETDECFPACPLRVPVPFDEHQLVPPPPGLAVSNPITASDNNFWGGEIGNEAHLDALPPNYPVKRKQTAQEAPLPQIISLDRKILRELKQSMLARSTQFTLRNNTKHHAFPTDEVPYPRSYDHKCLDTDVWETVFCEQHCGNVTFHTFGVPPRNVLDIGCGSGAWIMACAGRWKNCHFVGLDVVPLYPDLDQLELSQRVKWVQANFLEPLPFPDEEFDFVHVKRIARGVPEQKWDALFKEIFRVMKPGAVMEMVEEDLYIPGLVDTADICSSPSAISSGSSEELTQPPASSSFPRPSASVPDISAAYSGITTVRRSISERKNERPLTGQTTPNAPPSSFPVQLAPPKSNHPRVFPRQKPSNSTGRPFASHFKLRSLFPKSPSRDDGSETDGEQPRRTRKVSIIPTSLTLDRRRPSSSGGNSPASTPYYTPSGTLSTLTLESNSTIHAPSASTPRLQEFGGSEVPLSLPPVETSGGDLDVDFLQDPPGDELSPPHADLFSDVTPEDSGLWRPPANILSALNSGLFNEGEPTELNEWDEVFALIPQETLPKDILRSNPLEIPLTPSSSEVSSSTGLSLSVPESQFTDRSDQNDEKLLSPTSDASGPTRSQSKTSLAISPSRSTGKATPLPQNRASNEAAGVETSSVISQNAEAPPNPRQHRLLDLIYSEMHAKRSVNLAPISLIEKRIRTHFKDVCTRSPLIFAFPPPPGCQHRPESDAAEFRRGQANIPQRLELNSDQYRGLQPSKLSPLIYSFPFPPGSERRRDSEGAPPYALPLTQLSPPPPRSTRDRSSSVTNNRPGPSRARSSTIQSSHPFAANPETTNHRSLRSKRSMPSIRYGYATASNSVVVSGGVDVAGTSRSAMMNASVVGAGSPVRVANDELERPRQQTDSLFTPPYDIKGKRRSAEARKKLLTSALTLTRPPTGPLPIPSAFKYKDPTADSSPPATITLRDSGKGRRGFTVVETEGPQLNPPPCGKKAEADTTNLGLHLRVRVVEILGCSEAMWEWVREFQTRELEKERKRKQEALASKTVPGVGGGRVTYYQDRARNRGDRGKTTGGELVVPKTNAEPSSPVSKAPKSPTIRTTRVPLPPPVAKASKEKPKRVRAGGGRVSYFHQPTQKKTCRERANSSGNDHAATRPRSTKSSTEASVIAPSLLSAGSDGSRKGDDPYDRMERSIRQELLYMTRAQFDELLLWFQFDMDDSIRLSRSMTTRTPPSPYSTEPSEQRKLFDEACEKLAAHLRSKAKPHSPLTQSSECGFSSGSSTISRRVEEELCCLPPLLNLVHPSRRMSRTIRVWVAWKS